jgi:hypothetical protein
MTTYKDGVYFGMPAEEYHAIPRLSASGISNILISPATFWAASWMNPLKEEADEEQTKAQILGAAYHTARLEPHLFDKLYVRDIAKAEHPKALMNGTAVGEALGELGETKKRAGETAIEQARRLVDAGYTGEIWQILAEEADAQRGGRTAIDAKYYDQIRADMELIAAAPEINKHLTGGAAEIVILWTDEKSGVLMKSRLDYLKSAEYTDFKSFANSMGKSLQQLIADAFRYNRYYIQSVVYHDAVESIRGHAEMPFIFELQNGEWTMTENSIITDVATAKRPLDCWYVFQEKQGIPNLLARRVKLYTGPAAGHEVNAAGAEESISEQVAEKTIRKSALHMKAELEIRYAIRLFKHYCEEHGTDGKPWPPLEPTGEITDDDFNTHWLES